MTGPGIDPTNAGGYDGGQEPQGSTEGGGGAGGHPAFNEVYSVLPQEFHEKVAPVLKQWEANVNKRFEQVHSKYGQWDPIINQVGDPQQVSWAINMLQALENNPREVYDRIGEYYRFAQQQQDPTTASNGQGQQQQNQDDPYAQKIAQIERQNQLMTDYLSLQRQQQEQQQADQWLDNELNAARKKHGDFDNDYVLAQMQKGFSADEAAQAFIQMREKWGAPAPKPLIMGPGGGIPGSNTNVRNMKDQEVSSLVAQMLDQTFKAQQ